jgi:inorganic pyrophosphatase
VANNLNVLAPAPDIDDLERLLPGFVHEIREWYRLYKTVDGKPENAYAFDGEAKGKVSSTVLTKRVKSRCLLLDVM